MHKEAGERSKIQEARGMRARPQRPAPPSQFSSLSPPATCTDNAGTWKKKEQGLFLNKFTDPPFYFASLSLCFHPGIIHWLCYGNKSLFLRGEWMWWLDPGTRKQGRDWMGKFGNFYFSVFLWFVWLQTWAAECHGKNVLFMACLWWIWFVFSVN